MTPEQMRALTRPVENDGVSETFADSIEGMIFDGVTLKIDLAAIRWDQVVPPAKPSGRRVVVARLVLAAPTVIDLANKIQSFMANLQKAGVVKFTPPMAPTTETKQ